MPARYNIPNLVRNDYYPGFYLTFTKDETTTDPVTGEEVTNKVPIDLTGSTVRMHVRKSPDSDLVLELSTAGPGGITLTDAAQGEVRVGGFTVPDITGRYVYDLEVENSSGNVTTYLHGDFEVSPDVTHP